jgi:TolB-like protein
VKRIVYSIFFAFFVLVLSSPARPAEAESNADTVALYQSGDYVRVIDSLKSKPTRSVQEALYLGLSYLRLGNKEKAIDAWKEYVRLDPGSEGARDISQYLTLLIREEAKRTTRAIRKQEKITGNIVDPDAVAVSPFRNLGKATYDPLSKGLAEMIITDLSQVKSLKVVERIQIQALLDELKLSQSGLVDPKSAPEVGKLLGAGKIATGSFLDLDQEKMRLDAAIAETEDGKLITSPGVSGKLSTFYELEKSLVFKILCGLGQCPESLDSRTLQAVEAIHTKNFKAFRLYSQGLDFLDQGKYREASKSFFLALEEDPEFNLARRALLDTPLVPLDVSAMISGGEAAGRNQAAVAGGEGLPVALAIPDRGSRGILIPPISQQPIPTATTVHVHITFK